MFTVYIGLVFRGKYVRFLIICSLQYSININTVEIDPHSDLLHICIVKFCECIANLIFRPVINPRISDTNIKAWSNDDDSR